jgi:hypothetical protein
MCRVQDVLSVLIAAGLGGGCHKPCADELSVGSKYQVAVLDRYGPGSPYAYDEGEFAHCSGDVGSSYTCGAFDGVVPGASLDLRIVRMDGPASGNASCNFLEAEVVRGPAEVVFWGSSSESFAGGSFGAGGKVTVGECEGDWTLCFGKTSTPSVLDPPRVGEVPPVLMTRIFTVIGGTGCPGADEYGQRCDDTFVVQVSKI